MLTEAQRAFLNDQRVAHLATADASGAPHVVPVCFAVAGTDAYIAVDEKPKRRLGNALNSPLTKSALDAGGLV